VPFHSLPFSLCLSGLQVATEDLSWLPFFPGRAAGAPLGPLVSRLSSGQLLDLTAEQLQRRLRRQRRRALMLAKAVCGMWLKDFLRHSAWVADHRDAPLPSSSSKGTLCSGALWCALL